jgi:hypothetical protein
MLEEAPVGGDERAVQFNCQGQEGGNDFYITDFMSLDKPNKIGYYCVLKQDRRSRPPRNTILQCCCASSTHCRECAKREEKPANCLATPWTRSLVLARGSKKNSLKLTAPSGNVYENKGPLWKTPERSGNVFENKGY